MSGPIIGIDLGTTYSCVACWDDKLGRAEVISVPSSGRTMPSWVSFTSTGKLVGQPAKSQVSSNPKNTLYDIKRIIGRSFTDPVTQSEISSYPYEVIDGGRDQPKLVVRWYENERKELAPEEVSAMVLSELKLAAETKLGTKVTSAVITVPAHFNNQQRQATKDAGRIAGLHVKRIINEPTAAALAYGLHSNTKKPPAAAATTAEGGEEEEEMKSNVVIFDLGGGTFDVSVLIMNGGVFEVKATGGDTHLGGEDFDNAIVKWCLTQIEEKHSAEIRKKVEKTPRAISRLRRAVENAKRQLSDATSTKIEIDSLLEDIDLNLVLTRSTFEELNSVHFQRCLDTVKSVLVDAEVSLGDVTDVVLVGGSTRVPYLQTSLHALFDKRIDLCKSVHPDEAVAIGAAVQGHILSTGGMGGGKDLQAEATTDLLLLDVTPLSLGIELEGRQMSTLIKRNTAIPCKKTRTYTTVEDYQPSIDVVVYEGERPCVDANNELGRFVISGVERNKAGQPKIDVTFALDANGILNVSARDQVTDAVANATIKAERGRLTDDQIDTMIADAEKYRAQDEQVAKKVLYKTALEEAVYEVQGQEDKSEDEMVQLADMLDWLELDSDNATLEEMMSKGRILEDNYGVLIKTTGA